MGRFAFCALAVACVATSGVHAQPARAISDRDIVEAYEYMLGRLLVLRQENLPISRKGSNGTRSSTASLVAWIGRTRTFYVAYSEAWVAVDEKSCTLIELPK